MKAPRNWLSLALDDLHLASSRGPTLADADALYWERGLAYGAPRLPEHRTLAREAGVLGPVVRMVSALVEVALAEGAPSPDEAIRTTLVSLVVAYERDDLREAFDDVEGYRGTHSRAAISLGAILRKRRYLYGNPLVGLSLHHGLTAIDAHLVHRLLPLVISGEATDAAIEEMRQEADRARRVFVREVALLSRWRADIDGDVHEKAVRWQIARLGFSRPRRRALLEGAQAGHVGELCDEVLGEDAARHLLRLSLVSKVDGRPGPEALAFVHMAAERHGVRSDAASELMAKAETYVDDNRELFDPVAYAVAFELDGAPPSVKLARVVRQNLSLLWTEIRETGDLAFLLAKRGAGQPWTDEEATRAKEQLKDVARVVPGLAVLSLPGGALLLPLLLKLLPFDLRPSAFRGDGFRALEGDDGRLEEAEAQSAALPAAGAADRGEEIG